MAEPVNPDQALQIAKKFVPQSSLMKKVKGKSVEPQSINIVYTHNMPKSNRAAFYIVNVGDGSFVLVSADDVAHQILGYSFDKSFPIAEDGSVQLPPHIKGFFDDLAAQMEAAIEKEPNRAADADWTQSAAKASYRAPSNLPESVDPLINTTWDQGQFYNALCPTDANGPDGHVWTGCVATAMAQIVKYWGYPIHGRGMHSYDSNYGTLSVNYAESNYDYNNMPDALTSESSETQVNAIAKLMYDCGVAANMEYGVSESSAFPQEARAALINFFRFSPDLSFVEKSFFSNDEWNNLMREDLAANHPIIYSGFGTGGHTFVLDGYKEDDYFHFNFGWSGFADGWYLMSAVNPGSSDYNSSQSAIVGIVPDENGNVILGQTSGTSTFVVDEPLEFYHLMGHNAYDGGNYLNPCNNTVTFLSANNENQLVADFVEFEDQQVGIYDGANTSVQMRSLIGGNENDLSPIVSTQNGLTLTYSGNMYDAGFKLVLSQNSDCRMVSNIATAVESTTVHLTWTENGTATQWQVEYGEKGFSHGEGTLETVVNNTITIENLKKFTEYDFYIRSVGANSQYGPWKLVTLMVEGPYWQDIVVSQPVNYTIDIENHCVLISCAEDFVWYTKDPSGLDAKFVSDIDLSGYKWKPVGSFSYSIDGDGYEISNLYINEHYDRTALFSYYYSTIKNLGINGASIHGGRNFTGALCGGGSGTMINCYITNSNIIGDDFVGGLVAQNEGIIKNSYANVNVNGSRWTGLLSGTSTGTFINCYASGSIKLRSYCYYAGITAYANSGVIKNCYSIDLPMGVVGYSGMATISDTTSFYRNDTQWSLRTPINFEEGVETDLLNALNKGVVQMNDGALRNWIPDAENNGLPKFGDYYVVQYPNVENLTVQNIKQGNNLGVVLNWEEAGDAVAWEIKYQLKETPSESPVIVPVNTKPYTINNLQQGKEYTFSVRSVCDANHSGWTSLTEMVDLPFWTDIVTEQPEGYIEDGNGNVTISSPEGLAWLSAVVNGLHGNVAKTFDGKTISLTTDIDLQGYRWFPIGRGWYANTQYNTCFNGVFNGNNHAISGLYVNDSGCNLGLFGYAGYGSTETSFSDVVLTDGLVNCYYNNVDGGGYGGLLGSGVEVKEILGCSSNVIVKGTMSVGSLCGYLFDQEGYATVVSNCSATGDVYGRESTAGLIGDARGIIVQNSYATGSVYLLEGNWNPWNRGGLIGNFMSNAVVRNCYSTGSVEIDENCNQYGMVIGCPYSNSNTQYVYGLLNDELNITGPTTDVVSEASSFINDNGKQVLVTPITIDGNTYKNLLDVLNAWVVKTNDPLLKTWTADASCENGGYPILGKNYEPSCYNPTNVSIANATIKGDDLIRTRIEWEQEGDASSWEILYVGAQQSIDKGTIIPVTSNPCELSNLPVGELLDIYVRAKNQKGEVSGWSKSVRYIPDRLRWTEVVTSQPDGFYNDGNGYVYISSAEGLAWLASVVNNLNGNNQLSCPHNIILMSDIDLSMYRWTAMGDHIWGVGNIAFEGNGHVITGLYCNEYDNMQGLFRRINESTIKNVTLKSSVIKGLTSNGTIAGKLDRTNVVNCIVNGEVYGVMASGGVVGECVQDVYISNVAFVGIADTRTDITLPNCYNGFIGGISGTNNLTHIENSYVAAKIPTSAYSGIVAGSGSRWYSNLFALSYPTDLNLTCDNLEENSSWFTGSGSTWALNTPPYINGAFRSDLVDALNAWVDVNNSECQYRHWVADTKNVNEGYPIFAPIYTLTYKVDGEIYKTKLVEVGAVLTAESEPTKDGYVFGGWNGLPETMPDHDVEVTAHFYLYGDVNTDSKVNVVDVVDIARYVVETPSETFREKLADLNKDLTVNIADAVVLVNHIAGDQNFASAMASRRSFNYDLCQLQLQSTQEDELSLCLDGDADFTAFQFEVELPQGVDMSAIHINSKRKESHQLLYNKVAENRYRVVALSLSNAVFKGCEGELLNITLEGLGTDGICIHDIHFVTTNGTDICFDDLDSNSMVTGITDLRNYLNDTIYDLQGRRLSKVQRGVNIINGNKVVIK